MKKILILVGSIVLVILIAAGSFYGGMAYQRTRTDQTRANFLRERGLDPNVQVPGNFPGGFGNNGQARQEFMRGGVSGQVKSIEGNVLSLSTAQDVTTVNLSDATRIEKTTEGAVGDLQLGVRVMVTGQRDSDGVIAADQITILSDAFFPPGSTP